jgi:antirestriction protein ArdC
MTDKLDVYSRVTNKIVADLERGNLTWFQPWQAGHQAGPVSRPLRAGGKAYRGVNVLMLWAAAMEKGYSCPLWLTYKQAAELGGQVRKGEHGSHGSLVVYADKFTKEGTDDKGAAVEIEIPFMKGYTVFNAEQIDGLPGHFYATVPPLNTAINRLDTVEQFSASTKARIQHGGSRAFYSPDRDIGQMPELQSFRDGESYYATLAHEITHYAVSLIMPHGRDWRPSYPLSAMRRFGIIWLLGNDEVWWDMDWLLFGIMPQKPPLARLACWPGLAPNGRS